MKNLIGGVGGIVRRIGHSTNRLLRMTHHPVIVATAQPLRHALTRARCAVAVIPDRPASELVG